jgi:hypothetical protein
MSKKPNPVALAFGALAVGSFIAMAALSPVSASNGSYGTSAGYFPDQYVNQGTAIESAPADAYGDTGLSKTFPAVDPSSWIDSTPEMYS